MHQLEYFIIQNIFFLDQGIQLLEGMSNEVYAQNGHEYFSSGVGKHIRHVLDLYRCFVDAEDDVVDYDARQRNPRIESDRLYAVQEARSIIKGLKSLGRRYENQGLRVIKVNSNEGENTEGISPWCTSSVARELQYIVSHTIHHFALIAMIYQLQGGHPPKDFGVAPSTLLYEKNQQSS